MVGEPQGDAGDLGREFLDLDAEALVHVQPDQAVHIEGHLLPVTRGAQDVQLEQAQFTVGDDEEVAAAAGRLEEGQGSEFVVELVQAIAVAPHGLELGPQFIEKQRLDQLEDVGLGGVVRAQVPPGFRVHDRLEQSAEDRRGNAAPVQGAGLQMCFGSSAVRISCSLLSSVS